MSDRTYQPTGHGICATCGRDVGDHDAGHEYAPTRVMDFYCGQCERYVSDPIHDVGRVLRCP